VPSNLLGPVSINAIKLVVAGDDAGSQDMVGQLFCVLFISYISKLPIMPKKHRKIRIGSRLWSTQKWRDIQACKDRAKPAPKPKPKPTRYQKDPPPRDRKDPDPEDPNKYSNRPNRSRERWLACLGLTLANDTPASIKQAFRALARMLHPDKNPAPDATQRFQVMNSAYTRLCL
jgi:hypothetical protein